MKWNHWRLLIFLILLILTTTGCGGESALWPDGITDVDLIYIDDGVITVEYYVAETDTHGSQDLNPEQWNSLKALISLPTMERVGIAVTDAPENLQNAVLKALSKIKNEDVHVGIIGSTVSLEPLKKCGARDLALTGCDMSQFPVYDVKVLELGYCTGMDWSKLRDYAELEILSLGGTDLGPATLEDITAHETITVLDFDLSFQETSYTGGFPVVLKSGDVFPAELLPLLPYSQEELQDFLNQEGVRMQIRYNYFDS